ncbi:MAG: dihydrolipoamide dehydrogenase [Candidatus Cloacimonadota bacterium]|jgi:dihydrolipoamide dehydrogenase|nr:dihydrolipoamide dehydrogenase [Candidatus Cloacimonadota bacterium]
METTKVAIIGGGPGGYETAIRLHQFGIETTVFEKERLGGVCLNWGCIPTKTLVKVADLYHEIKNAKDFGISVSLAEIDYSKVWKRKNKVVEQLVSGIEFIFKKRKIPVVNENVIAIKKIDSGYEIHTANTQFKAEYVVLATGTLPQELPFMKFDEQKILSSTGILKMQQLPKHLVIIGGGVIGCEFASIYNQLGVKVEIVEFLPRLVSTEDEEISKRLAMAFKKSKIKLHLKTAVEDYEEKNDLLVLKLSNGKQIETEKVLLSVGRKPHWNIEMQNCELNREKGFIQIDKKMQTNLENMFAIGDITGKLMLAHTASKQGLLVADIINNELNDKAKKLHWIDYQKIPACTFTNPEVASVGITEQQAKERAEDYSIGKFPFSANGKALGLGQTYGLVKVVAAKKTGELLGIHIIGPQATELIAQAGVMIGLKASVEDIKKIVFAHPTLSEAVMEAVEDVENLAIHKM